MADFDPVRAYEQGFVGARFDPAAYERFEDMITRNGGNPRGGEVAMQWGFAGRGEGKLTLNFRVVEDIWGKSALPGPAQVRGDCVSHGCKNACLYALSHEIMNRVPDEVTGKLEGKPKVSPTGVKAGVLSTEAIYNFRSHGGDGWSCHDAADMVCTRTGAVLRQDYGSLGGPNLETYSGSTAGRYYRGNPPPEKWQAIYKEHQVRQATNLKGPEQVRDFLAAANCGVFFCSGLGWSKTRDENGYSAQRGSWSHSQCIGGYDDRPEIKKIYGEALVLIGNSWGSSWIGGPRKILGTNIEIPNGYYWAKSSLINRMSPIALSSVNGWPIGKMPSYGAKGNI